MTDREEQRTARQIGDLTPANELARFGNTAYPNDSEAYRQARMSLLASEIDLRRMIQQVAEERRALPFGGQAADYRFRNEQGAEVGLADLFGRHDTLFTYFWMFGPERERPCPMCTSFLGTLDQPSRDLEQRVSVAVIGRSPVARQLAFARERGWNNLRFYETIGDVFATDYHMLSPDGGEGAGLDVWVRRGRVIHHFWGAEGGTEIADPGFDPHLAPDVMLWNILDLTPGGRGSDWYPALEYT